MVSLSTNPNEKKPESINSLRQSSLRTMSLFTTHILGAGYPRGYLKKIRIF